MRPRPLRWCAAFQRNLSATVACHRGHALASAGSPRACRAGLPSDSLWSGPASPAVISLVLSHVVLLTGTAAATGEQPPQPLDRYLAGWNLAAEARGQFELSASGGEPEASIASMRLLVRLIDRLQAAPGGWQQAWREQAVPLPPADAAACLQADRPVRLAGLASATGMLSLPGELAVIAGRKALALVRLQSTDGPPVWLVVPELPKAWPSSGRLAERIKSEAMLVAVPPPGGQEEQPLVAVSLGLSWWPDRPLAELGMDYGLFASVVDGRPLEATEAEAFYHALAAAGPRPTTPARQPLPPADLVPLLDPASDWFAVHRGDELVLEGTARRITRVPVTADRWQVVLGQDHYWEVFLFVPTPLLEIGGRRQESYPVVCCCLELPAGLAAGDRVTERLRVAGFAFKRYRYETRESPAAGGAVRESPLLVAGRPLWLPAAPPARLPVWLEWLPLALVAAAVMFLLARFRRGRRRSTIPLPDRIDLPIPPEAGREPPEKSEIGPGPLVNP